MKIRVMYFAGLREKLGSSSEELELPADVATLAALRIHLASRGGAWQGAFAEQRLVRMALNQDMAQPGASIRAGDEVAFFPPVTGG